MPYKDKEKRLEYNRQYRENNHRKEIWRHKQYYISNKEKCLSTSKEYQRSWNKTDKGKAKKQRANASRRQLGFLFLNKPFKGAEGHHISENFIIYIPKMIHRSIQHNIWTWQGMDIINKLAIGFL